MAKVSRDRRDECARIQAELEPELPVHARRSAESGAAIAKLLSEAGVECPDLAFDADGLALVEGCLHRVALGEIAVDSGEFTKLTGYFFAQCLVEQGGAHWGIHDVCTKKWAPYIALRLGELKIGVLTFVEAVYANGVGKRPKRQLSKHFREWVGEGL